MPDAEKQPVSWTSLIPEVYFDLISRIPPGTALLIGLWVWITPSDHSRCVLERLISATGISAVILLGTLLAAGYVVGVLLGPLATLIVYRSYRKHVWRGVVQENTEQVAILNDRYKDLHFDAKDPSDADCDRLDRTLFTYLMETTPQPRAAIPKLRAEAHLCNSSAAAALVLAVFIFVTAAFHAIDWFTVATLLVIFLTSLCAGWERTRRIALREFSLFRYLGAKKHEGDHRRSDNER